MHAQQLSNIFVLAACQARGRSTRVRGFLAQRRPSEYNLRGYLATELKRGVGCRVVELILSTLKLPVARIVNMFERIVATQHAARSDPAPSLEEIG
jgi:hypothetical protein